ncbi:hypothetical protein [Bacillus massiliglaciei]|uniref:hypothetical protein n=1 Tax=Bacillus massiliglaciei TaxID=1816693 RepID=UPI000DA60342|nr:hypothetical protein [Bacillus massiliglaciei]
MKFISFEQQKRFSLIKNQIPSNLSGDRELISIAYIMASSKELEQKMIPYVNWVNGFDYEKMFQSETFSNAEKVLAKLAVALYDNGVDLQFHEVFTKLDQYQKEMALHIANYRYNRKNIYEAEDGNLFIN